ncbi:hypothetical protein KUG47_12150 [Falsochrobactrum sp. TDYN1]|uniref:Uncharacterized protein n=1 Tax=Falsochrobactrum tianjinense TaxID=2706015 RepID=A0A949PMV1_9HYPH|nr:hypothetical protein [Falsochrobactrum sp. TDYN1]MBV2144246.1 hypothetical protein [Falsochrobactrum sp. TDYN1]
MDQLFFDGVVLAAAIFAALAGVINIVSVILLRNRLFDLESMIIWKWSEAPWWTRILPESTCQDHLANKVFKRECHRCVCESSAVQSGFIEKEN